MNAFRVEFGNSRSILIDTSGVGSGDVVNANPSPVKIVTGSNADDALVAIESSFAHQTGTNDVNQTSFPDNIIHNLRDSFSVFFGNISNIGRDEKTKTPPSIVAGLTCGLISLIPNVGQLAFSVIAQSVHEAYAGLTTFIGPNGDQIARTVFSGVVLASAAIRTAFAIVKEAVFTIPDPSLHFVFTVISLVFAACHVVISTISTVIGTNNLPALFSKDGKGVNSEHEGEKIKETLNGFFKEVGEKLGELNNKGLIGWLGVVREWLLTSVAVVGFLSVLPLVVKTAGIIISAPVAAIVGGAITLIIGILEVVQGVNEYRLLSDELKQLRAKKSDANHESSSPQEKLQLEADIKNKILEINASKVRIGKGVIGILTSIAGIVLGTLTLAASIAVPFLPAVITAISLTSLVVYLVVTITLRQMRKQDEMNMKSLQEAQQDSQKLQVDDAAIVAKDIQDQPDTTVMNFSQPATVTLPASSINELSAETSLFSSTYPPTAAPV